MDRFAFYNFEMKLLLRKLSCELQKQKDDRLLFRNAFPCLMYTKMKWPNQYDFTDKVSIKQNN